MKYETPGDIPDAVVKRIKSLKTYQFMARRRANDRGVPVETLTDDDWRQIYWDKSRRRREYYVKTELPQQLGEPEPVPEPIPDSGDISMSDYLAYYADPAPNDLLTLQQLLSMQQQLRLIEKEISTVITAEPINVSRWQALVRMQKDLSGETRLLQESLGISRRAREAREHEEEMSDYLQRNIAQSKELMADYGLWLYCPHCIAEGQKILHGWVIHHMPEMGVQVTTRCPGCQREYSVERPPRKWERHVERTR